MIRHSNIPLMIKNVIKIYELNLFSLKFETFNYLVFFFIKKFIKSSACIINIKKLQKKIKKLKINNNKLIISIINKTLL